MTIRKAIIVLSIGICFCMSMVAFATPINEGNAANLLNNNNKETAYAKDWKCAYCGSRATTGNNSRPGPGICLKNNNGPHDYRRIN